MKFVIMMCLMSMGMLFAESQLQTGGPIALEEAPFKTSPGKDTVHIEDDHTDDDAKSSKFQLNVALNSVQREKFNGLQFGLLTTKSLDTLQGWQFAFLANNGNILRGVQSAYIYGKVEDLTGVQFAFFHSRAHFLKGLQFSAFNSVEQGYGLQMGFVNRAGTMTGMQWGFINVSDTLKGMPYGLLNFSRSGISGWGAQIDENQMLSVVIRTGGLNGYNMLILGRKNDSEGLKAIQFGYGLGYRFPIWGDYLKGMLEYSFAFIIPTIEDLHKDAIVFSRRINLGMRAKLIKGIYAYVTPSLLWFFDENSEPVLQPQGLSVRLSGKDASPQTWLGFQAGIIFGRM
jgi:hypothetical protein